MKIQGFRSTLTYENRATKPPKHKDTSYLMDHIWKVFTLPYPSSTFIQMFPNPYEGASHMFQWFLATCKINYRWLPQNLRARNQD